MISTTADDPVRWGAIERAFAQALDQPAGSRLAWLRDNVGDESVRREVEAMVAAHERVTGVLDRPPAVAAEDVRVRVEQALRDRYTISRVLGRGGSATVFAAREHKHNREVVLKVLHPEVAALVGVQRFVSEVRIAAQLSHPHILPLIDSGEAGGILYYVMPRLEGDTLRDRLHARGKLGVKESVELLRDVADALAAAHAKGIVHRDLKPENVLCAGSHAYLLDFGIARHVETGIEQSTQEGMVIGTLGYMSPEQSAGMRLDARSDLYAWGVMAREMLTGVGPLSAEQPALDGPRPLTQLIEQALNKRPDDRPSSARDIVSRLDTLGARSGGRRTGILIAAAAVIVAIGAWAASRATDASQSIAGPVAVAPLRNETGDTTLGIWGRMAADWLTQGLHETSLINVVPWPTVRHAAEAIAAEGREVTPAAVAANAHAGSVVSGAYYLTGDRVTFRLDVTDARRDQLIASLPPIEVSRDSLPSALYEARTRLMGFVALALDERAPALPDIARRPPTFEAYGAFDRGLALYNRQEYGPAATEFRQSWNADTTFVVPLIYAANAHWNRNEVEWTDTLVTMAQARRDRLSEYDQLQVEYLAALLASNGARAAVAGRRAVAIAPDSRAAYNLGRDLIAMDRSTEALEVLRAINPDAGLMKGWPSYWTQLTHALHLTKDHVAELDAARQMRARFPDLRVAWVLEARALATLGRLASLDSLLALTEPMPSASYWSHGAALVVAGEELYVHGDSARGRVYLERAIEWLRRADAAEPKRRDHPYWLGSAYYDLARWRESAETFARLHRDHPTRFQHRGLDALGKARLGDAAGALRLLGPAPRVARSEHTIFRARLAAIGGDTASARALRAQSLAEVSDGYAWLHAWAFRDFGAER